MASAEKLVIRVNSVEARLVSPKPPRLGLPELVVTAYGTVPTTGWSKGQLVSKNPKPTPDGVYEFEFMATPPDGPAGDVVSGIVGGAVIADPQRNAKAVRVRAAENSEEAPITAQPVPGK
jgi:hypothetical protein